MNFGGVKPNSAESRLTLFGRGCYSQRVPIGRGFEPAGIVPGSSARSASTQTNDHASSPPHHVPHESRTNARDAEAMNVFDDSTARNLESSLQTMTPAHDNHTGGSAVLDAPEHAQPSPAESLTSAPDVPGHDAPRSDAPETEVREKDARDDGASEHVAPAIDAVESLAPDGP